MARDASFLCMIPTRWKFPLIIWLLASVAGLVAWLDFPTVIRAPVVFLYVLVGTGMGWVRLLNVARGLAEWSLMTVLSLSIAAIAAIVMLYAGAWSPPLWLLFLIGVGMVGGALVAWQNPAPPKGEL
jgi:hypothetical protein